DPPQHHGHAPNHKLGVSARKRDPHPLPLRRKHPGIADIAIKRRLEVDQHETYFLHLAAEVATGQAMGKFVYGHDGERHDPQEKQSVQIKQTFDAASELAPMEIADRETSRYRKYGEDVERFRERPFRARQQPLEDFLRINRQQFPIEKISIFELVRFN